MAPESTRETIRRRLIAAAGLLGLGFGAPAAWSGSTPAITAVTLLLGAGIARCIEQLLMTPRRPQVPLDDAGPGWTTVTCSDRGQQRPTVRDPGAGEEHGRGDQGDARFDS